MKKKIILVINMLIVLLVCGCVDTNITVDIERNGDMTLYSEVLVKDYVFESLSEEELKSLKEQFDNVEKITALGQSGYKITKNLGNLKESKNQKLDDLINEGERKDLIEINNDKNIFYDTYEIKFNIKDYMLENKDTSTSQGVINEILSALFNSSNINFNLKVPFELLESNSTTSNENDNKYIYTWNYTPSNMDNIHVKAKVYNTKNIIIISMASIVIIGILTLIVLKINKKNKMD